jgi:hypothetical protein
MKGRKPHFPKKIPYQKQINRLGALFDQTTKGLDSFEQGIDVSFDPRAVVPERALVFELIGPVAEFEVAAQALGLEWLISEDLKVNDDEDADEAGESDVNDVGPAALLYLTMPSLQGLKRLLALWRQFAANKEPLAEYRALWKLFGYLKDLRVWSAKDRVDPSIAKYVHAILNGDPDRHVLVEIDLWYRSESERRDRAIETLRRMVKEVGGQLLDLVHVPEIRYQGALVNIPASVARKLAENDSVLARLDDIMTIRPQSGYISHTEPLSAPSLRDIPPGAAFPTRRCITALLDGYPVAGHAALLNRLTVHEVDVTGLQVPVAGRHHGTAMASLVLHGDLHSALPPLSRNIAVIPVLASAPGSGRETTPQGKLPIGVIYRAIKAIVDAAALKVSGLEHITIVNHSLCDTFSPFVRRPSPWAALLDHFSYSDRLLFVVSAGNIFDSFPLNDYSDMEALRAADPQERQAAFLNAIEKAKGGRGLLNPAESVNSLTVGALHGDGAAVLQGTQIDPYPSLLMTNLASAIGFGVNRGLKPDLVEYGGRFLAGCSNRTNGGVDVHAKSSADLGHLVAAPSAATGDLRHVMRVAGTSNAAALVTRSLVHLADAVEDAYAAEKVDWLSLATRVPILKALIAHGCGWGSLGRILEDAYPPQNSHGWSSRRDTISKFLGYGRPIPERTMRGSESRITLLADDLILPEALNEYRIPLPSSMLNSREIRSITITLAWTSPIVNTSADYRGVALKIVDIAGKKGFWEGVGRSDVLQPNGSTSERGTLTHLILEGKKLNKAALKDGIFIGVQASARHPSQKAAQIPYALAVTLEMAQSQRTGLYAEVRDTIRARAQARATTRVGGRS